MALLQHELKPGWFTEVLSEARADCTIFDAVHKLNLKQKLELAAHIKRVYGN